MKNIALIPARGGSKGVINKNLKHIAGYPLIYWSIKHALETNRVSSVYVSTDSPEIAEVAKFYGAEVPFLRPTEYAQDDSTTESVMLHFGRWLLENKIHCDNLVLLQPTSPLRLFGTLQNAIFQFEKSGADSLVSVYETHKFFWQRSVEGILKSSYDYFTRPRRQDIKPEDRQYMETGSIYISEFPGFMKAHNRLFGEVELFVMNEIEAIEIDSDVDFRICESLFDSMEDPYDH